MVIERIFIQKNKREKKQEYGKKKWISKIRLNK